MEKETCGIVISVAKQWWLKVNTKPVRFGPLDGATFPHVIKVEYEVDGNKYISRKWIKAGHEFHTINTKVKIIYNEEKPNRGKIIL